LRAPDDPLDRRLRRRRLPPHPTALPGENVAKRGVTPSRLALAWVLAQGDDVVPIPGTRRTANLEENVAAGERYAPQGMQTLNH
jgi:aryl-alcohol dehydrogenase-like predicted oxidoreductase